MSGSSFDKEIDDARRGRRALYEQAAEAITAGDAEPAKGILSTAKTSLREDISATDGALLEADEPRTAVVTEPDPASLEDPDLMAVWSDLLEMVINDPVIERAEASTAGGETDAC